jgi:hypothetical protein
MDAIELLLSKNAEERKRKTEFLVAGTAKDYAEYRHICGVIRGLDLADEHLHDLAKRMNDDDGDDSP